MSDEVQYVRCPCCGNEQADMGANVECDECGEGPMPFYRDGVLIDES
jgi:hypothetical protein